MKIVVLVKQVPDTWSERRLDPATGLVDRTGDVVIDEVDERALEVALRHAEATGAEVVALTMGPAQAEPMLRKTLASGADRAVHVLHPQLAGADMGRTAAVLAAAIRDEGFDLVLAGNESTDGRGGVVPAMIAEHLGVPHLTFLDAIQIGEGRVAGLRRTEYGGLSVSADLPAMASVTEQAPEPRFPNFRGIMRAKKKPLTAVPPAEGAAATTHVASVTARPERTTGTKIVDDGAAAPRLAEFLAQRGLI